MVFTSSIFIFVFLPVVLFFYYLADEKYRNRILLISSLLFYSWGEPVNILLMLLSILVNFIFGFRVEEGKKFRKLFLILSICYNLGLLFVFKYLNFTLDIIGKLTGIEFMINEIILPIGISFYTFQIMSYVIDVYRNEVKVQRNILDLALYISLFPQLIAGPIVRYSDVEQQIRERTVSLEKFKVGVIRFAIGFSKKVLIADQLSPLADICFGGKFPSVFVFWAGAAAYTLQIYFDFSGYSDMAIGLGKMLGFDFLENFNFPYISESIQEFWRRWHISLGSWFRDYVYIPLGGSLNGKLRTYVNYIIVFFLTGLWHGASFNFIVWGLFYAVFIIIERLGFKRILKNLPVFVCHTYSMLIIIIGWVFFRAADLNAAVMYIRGMFTLSGKDAANFFFVMNSEYAFLMIAGIFFSLPHTRLNALILKNRYMIYVKEILIMLVFILAIMYMTGSGYSPFLYFRF